MEFVSYFGDPLILKADTGILQKLEEKARKAEEAFAAEEKLRKELEGLNSKLLAEKTALLDSLAGEKGSLAEYQEKSAKLQAQKNDLDNQLRVSSLFLLRILGVSSSRTMWFKRSSEKMCTYWGREKNTLVDKPTCYF